MQASDAILGNLEFLGICRSSSMIDSYVCFMFQCNMSITNKKKVLHSEIKEIILLVRNFCKLSDIRKVKALSFQAEVENDNFSLSFIAGLSSLSI